MKNKENFFSIVLFFLFFVSLSSTALVANAQSALPAGPYAYITNSGNNTTSVIDTATNSVTATVEVGSGPSEVAIGKFIGSLPAQPVLPVTNFSSNVTKGNAPLSVQFTDLSENVTEWNWNFGDGVTSTEQNPTHTYSTAGTYTVNLTESYANGTISKTATIDVQEKSSSSGGSSNSHSSGSRLISVSNGRSNNTFNGSTDNMSKNGTTIQPENNTLGLEQNNGSTIANVEPTPEQTQSPNTSGEGSTKAPGLEIVSGIICLLGVFLFKNR